MTCQRCNTPLPEFARFCHACGLATRSRDADADTYVVQPAERVNQLALISSLMPHANRRAADQYRWALVLGIGVVLLLITIGQAFAAVICAAALMPALYVTYLADAQLWRESARPVLVALVVTTAALAVIITVAFFYGSFGSLLESLYFALRQPGAFDASSLAGLVAFGVALPAIGFAAACAVAITIVRRPAFDDMLDGFTFGVAAGVVYAAVESIVGAWQLVVSASGAGPLPLPWFSTVVGFALIKPVVYGAAAGIAVAVYSGIGSGYAGLRRDFVVAFALSAGAVVAYALGVHVLWALSPAGPLLALLWGIAAAAAIVLYARRFLQTALLEWTIQSLAPAASSLAIDRERCPECEMPLTGGAAYCMACGALARATSAAARRAPPRNAAHDPPPPDVAAQLFRFEAPIAIVLVLAAIIGLGFVGAVADAQAWVPADAGTAGDLGESAFTLVGTATEGSAEGKANVSVDLSAAGQTDVSELMSGVGADSDWQVQTDGGRWATLANGRGGFLLAQTTSVDDPAVAATQLLAQVYARSVGDDPRQAVLRQSPARPLRAFGNLRSRAVMSYEGTQLAALGAHAYRANLYAGVLNDGTVLILETRVYAPTPWGETAESWTAAYRAIWEEFAGASLPPA